MNSVARSKTVESIFCGGQAFIAGIVVSPGASEEKFGEAQLWVDVKKLPCKVRVVRVEGETLSNNRSEQNFVLAASGAIKSASVLPRLFCPCR